MQKTTKTNISEKKEQIITKSDWLSPTQFAIKHKFTKAEKEILKKVTQSLYKSNTSLNTPNPTPMVIRNRNSHNSSPVPILINPKATQTIIDRVKKKLEKEA